MWRTLGVKIIISNNTLVDQERNYTVYSSQLFKPTEGGQ